jgi:hypothetical protein
MSWPCDPVPSADVRKVLVELESHAGSVRDPTFTTSPPNDSRRE